MASTITIRPVPQGVRDALAARAASQGQSLQEYMLRLAENAAATPSIESIVERLRSRKTAVGSALSADDIVALRDLDRQ